MLSAPFLKEERVATAQVDLVHDSETDESGSAVCAEETAGDEEASFNFFSVPEKKLMAKMTAILI